MRLRVMSKVGRPRRRVRWTFDTAPQVIDVDENEMWPADTKECRSLGLWPMPPDTAKPRRIVEILFDDTDKIADEAEDGKLVPVALAREPAGDAVAQGGLFVQVVADDYTEKAVTELAATNRALTKERDALAEERDALKRQLARQLAASAKSTGSPERLAPAAEAPAAEAPAGKPAKP